MSHEPRRPAPEAAMGERFEDVVLPHLDAAYRLARWLLRNEHDAEDAVQEASLKAFRYFRTYSAGNGRAWFLSIVRNTCRDWRSSGFQPHVDQFDEEQHSQVGSSASPETLMLQSNDVAVIERALRAVPNRFRELLVLREVEGLSYRELADVLGIPMGTVMSGLSRARQALRTALTNELTRAGTTEPLDRDRESDTVLV